MNVSEEEKIKRETEMLHEFMYEMNSSQLKKLTSYACKLLNDKRYKKNKK
jgi:hypothetical protein